MLVLPLTKSVFWKYIHHRSQVQRNCFSKPLSSPIWIKVIFMPMFHAQPELNLFCSVFKWYDIPIQVTFSQQSISLATFLLHNELITNSFLHIFTLTKVSLSFLKWACKEIELHIFKQILLMPLHVHHLVVQLPPSLTGPAESQSRISHALQQHRTTISSPGLSRKNRLWELSQNNL